MAADVFGYIELADPDAVPRDALVHSFELYRRGSDLLPSMKLVGEDASTPHIETLKTKQEKRSAKTRPLTKGVQAIVADTPVTAEIPTFMEIPLYHFTTDVEAFLENPNVVKSGDILPSNSPLLTPRSVSGDEKVEFALKSDTEGVTFTPKKRAEFTDFYVGPVGDRDHRVALHGFLAQPVTILIQGRGKVTLQPGFEMVSILKGKIVPTFKPTGKKVNFTAPAAAVIPSKFSNNPPNADFFEPQDPSSLGCGRHALNNLLGGLYFVKDDGQEITEANIRDLPLPISLSSLCRYLSSKKAVGGSNPCPENENYEDSVMIGGLRIIGYTATPVIIDDIIDSTIGFIVNTKKPKDHWVALRRAGNGYTLIDSLNDGTTQIATLEDIREAARKGDYRSVIKVEYTGQFIEPIMDSTPDTPAASPAPAPAPAPSSFPAAELPIERPIPPTEGLDEEENKIGPAAANESRILARAVLANLSPPPQPTEDEQRMNRGADERLAVKPGVNPLFKDREARSRSTSPSRSASPAPAAEPALPTVSSVLSSILPAAAPAPEPAPAPAPATVTVDTGVIVPPAPPAPPAAVPDCLKIKGTVDDKFNENIHTAIKSFVQEKAPSYLTPEGEKAGLNNANLNTYLDKIRSSKNGKGYTLLLPTQEGKKIETIPNSGQFFKAWTVPDACSSKGSDVIKVNLTSGSSTQRPSGNAFVHEEDKKVGGAAVTEWAHFEFELDYA
jgi:hypothetical protein